MSDRKPDRVPPKDKLVIIKAAAAGVHGHATTVVVVEPKLPRAA